MQGVRGSNPLGSTEELSLEPCPNEKLGQGSFFSETISMSVDLIADCWLKLLLSRLSGQSSRHAVGSALTEPSTPYSSMNRVSSPYVLGEPDCQSLDGSARSGE